MKSEKMERSGRVPENVSVFLPCNVHSARRSLLDSTHMARGGTVPGLLQPCAGEVEVNSSEISGQNKDFLSEVLLLLSL
jgi:hypothetical protein